MLHARFRAVLASSYPDRGVCGLDMIRRYWPSDEIVEAALKEAAGDWVDLAKLLETETEEVAQKELVHQFVEKHEHEPKEELGVRAGIARTSEQEREANRPSVPAIGILHASDLHFAAGGYAPPVFPGLAFFCRLMPHSDASADRFVIFARQQRQRYQVMVLSGDLATHGDDPHRESIIPQGSCNVAARPAVSSRRWP